MALVILIVLAVCLFSFPTLRCAVFHPVHLVRYGITDPVSYTHLTLPTTERV